MNYFVDCVSSEEIKGRYRKLILEFHPDKNDGSAESVRVSQELNRQYSIEMAFAIGREKTGATADEVNDEISIQEAVRQATEFACGLPDVDVIIRGSWVWIEKTTKELAPKIKEFEFNGVKFRWSPKRDGKPWYYAAVRSFNRGGSWSMDRIEERYGAQRVKSQGSSGMSWRGGK